MPKGNEAQTPPVHNTPAPEAATETPTPTEPGNDSAEDSTDELFSDIVDEPDEIEVDHTAPAQDAPPAPAEPAPASTPTPTPSPATSEPAAPAATPEGAPAPKPEPTPAPAPAPEQPPQPGGQQPVAPEGQPPAPDAQTEQAKLERFFNDSVEQLATQVYQLDDATKEKLDTNPSEVMPHLAARLHMQVLVGAITQVANLLPTLMPQFQQEQTQRQELENRFFTTFPKLQPHKADVERFAAAYRQANPEVDAERAIKEIGAMAMVALQIPFDTPPQAPAAPVPGPVTPTSARGGTPAPVSPGDKNFWAEMVDFEET